MAKKATATSPEQKPPETFEAALEELESITGRMEAGDVALDESLRLYERGTFLVGFCQKRLDAAERQIEVLGQSPDGKVKAEPYDD